MSDLNKTLAQSAGVYQFNSTVSRRTIEKFVDKKGWRFVYLNGRKLSSKAEFLSACAKAFSFPAYFGNNWDAFEECLRDLPALAGYAILFEATSAFMQTTDWQTAKDILQSTAREKKFLVLVRG